MYSSRRSTILLPGIGAAILFSVVAAGFVLLDQQQHQHQLLQNPLIASKNRHSRASFIMDHGSATSLLYASDEKGDDVDGSADDHGMIDDEAAASKNTPRNKKKTSIASNQSRMGGRNPRRKKKQLEESVENSPEDKKGGGPRLVVPALLLVLALSLANLFGSDSDNPSYVYYQSTVFESTIVRDDGRREMARRENFRSNLPDLVRQQQQQQRRGGDDDSSSTNRLLEEVDKEAERALNDAMEMQRRMMNDFFY